MGVPEIARALHTLVLDYLSEKPITKDSGTRLLRRNVSFPLPLRWPSYLEDHSELECDLVPSMNVTFKGVPSSFKDSFWSVESIQPKLCCVGILGIPRALHRWVLSHKALGQDCSVGMSVSCFLCVSLPLLQTNRSSNEAKSSCI